jgi:hypothetical protein
VNGVHKLQEPEWSWISFILIMDAREQTKTAVSGESPGGFWGAYNGFPTEIIITKVAVK